MTGGIDVSNHQGRIDWQKVARSGVRFAWVKATEGTTFVDPWFERNRREAKAAGILVGAYHYARPDRMNSSFSEVEHFLDVAKPEPGELLPVLDLEVSGRAPGTLRAWARVFLRELGEAIDADPVFYSYPWFVTASLSGADGLERYPLWLASYGPNDGRPHDVRPVGAWKRIAVHQFTSSGSTPGVAGRCDLNRLLDASLDDLVYKRQPPAEPAEPARTLLPKSAWEWGRWYLGLGEYAGRRRDKVARPDVPRRIPKPWWRTVRWYLDRIAEQPPGPAPNRPATPPKDERDDPTPPKAKPKTQPVKKLSAWARRQRIRRQMAEIALAFARRPELGHYRQTRPIPTLAKRYTLADLLDGEEWTTDCSGLYKTIAKLAGAPDPDGLGVWGNTWTFIEHMREVYQPALGDAVLYDGHVVAIVGFEDDQPTRDLSKINVVSHGSEPGPYGWPEGELTADYRDDFVGFYRIPGL